MKGALPTLLLAVFTVVVRCQKPEVTLATTLSQIFIGDLIYLKCVNIKSGSEVKWYLNNDDLRRTGEFLKITVTSSSDSDTYYCEHNGQRSEGFPVNASDLIPSASLTIHSGQPVILRNSSVNLMIEYEDGLKGWRCWIYRGNKLYKIILTKVQEGAVSYIFEPDTRSLPETIVWCSDKTKEVRSNQIILRTSAKDVLLEMYPYPAIVGESLTLKCMVWGTDQISKTVFYLNDKIIQDSDKPTYEIPNVADSLKGHYQCNAVFTYRARTSGPSKNVTSDSQEVFVQAHPKTAVLYEDKSCDCKSCPGGASYRYYKKDGQSWVHMGNQKPHQGGTYRCRAVWKNMRSFPSASIDAPDSGPPLIIVIIVFVIIVLALVLVVVLYLRRKRSQATGAIYEDVGQKGRDKDEDKYQTLQGGRGRDAEYDTLKLEEMGGEKKEGEYEPLKKDDTKDGVYHTLGQAGAAGADGGYEALKKGGMKDEVYHSLGQAGAAGEDGGYEALKKEGVKEGVYHTLGKEGAEGGDEKVSKKE